MPLRMLVSCIHMPPLYLVYICIITDLYCKPMDGHQYLHYDSCHPDHIKRSIIFSQTLQLKRICSKKNDLNVHVEDRKT